jgi:transposase InsO family protein
MVEWAYANGVTLDFFRTGKPTDNAFIESFNGRLRDDPKGGAANVLTQTDSCLWTTLEARSRRGDEAIMRSVLTHPWAGLHRPNLRHPPGLTSADEGRALTLRPEELLGDRQGQ